MKYPDLPKTIEESTQTSTKTLLDARQESLQHITKFPLQARGKLFGMDTFSWVNPSHEELINTFDALPFQLIWICNAITANELLNLDVSLLHKIKTIIQYDKATFTLDKAKAMHLNSYLCISDLSEGLESILGFRKQKCAVIFTSDASTNNYLKTFEDFLKVNQNS
jgi:hypothetical protein